MAVAVVAPAADAAERVATLEWMPGILEKRWLYHLRQLDRGPARRQRTWMYRAEQDRQPGRPWCEAKYPHPSGQGAQKPQASRGVHWPVLCVRVWVRHAVDQESPRQTPRPRRAVRPRSAPGSSPYCVNRLKRRLGRYGVPWTSRLEEQP